MRRLKTVRRPPIYPKTPGHLPCSSLTHPLPLSSRRPSVSFGGFGLRELQHRRSDPRQKDTTGIIFVDSRDSVLDVDDNSQIKTVTDVLRSLAPNLEVKVAVSDDPNSAEVLDLFAAGEADVLIVKQMASVGLD